MILFSRNRHSRDWQVIDNSTVDQKTHNLSLVSLSPLNVAECETDSIRYIQSGHPDSRSLFDALISRHLFSLKRRCMMWLRCPFDADDALQESLLRGYRFIHAYRGDSGFKTWLYSIVDNQCRTSLKNRSKLLGRVSTEVTPDELISPDEAKLEEMSPGVLKIIEKLPEPVSRVLLLRYYHELALEDISQVLGVGLSAAKMRLYRAQKLFEKEYVRQRNREG